MKTVTLTKELADTGMNLLLCGHRSFVARGLVAALRGAGHEVVVFGRGPLERRESCLAEGGPPVCHVSGPVEQMGQNPFLREMALQGKPFDAVINYILLKDDGIDKNVAYVESLLTFCREQPGKPVPHLVHMSSISSYRASVRLIDEAAEIETIPERKGSYGSLKAATDLYLLKHTPSDLKLSLVRPGFVLGEGLINPIVGTAARLPWNKLLVIGNGKSMIPMTSRELVNQAVTRIVSSPPAESREVLILADPNSPTRVKFLEACCRELGLGTGVVSLPTPIWWWLAFGGEAAARLIGQAKLQPYSKLTARLTRHRFESARTSQRLGTALSVDWRSALRGSLDGQEANYDLPRRTLLASPEPRSLAARAGRVTFLGFGRIVRQKYLPALKHLGFSGEIRAFDLCPGQATEAGLALRIEAIDGAKLPDSDLFVIASPGPAHEQAIDLLKHARGTTLVEKPLCYTKSELARWVSFGAGGREPVYVCHNYRFKQNVSRMMQHLARFNPGKLHHAELNFQSPPAANDSAAWLRDERRARTLLMDYAIHFLDLACMFGPARPDAAAPAAWNVGPVRCELNSNGQTELIEGRLLGNHSVSFLIRQGFGPRRARLRFTFQNYAVSLGFFPDTFVAFMADDNPWLHRAEAIESRRKTVRKIIDKLRNRDSDDSHTQVLSGILGRSPMVDAVSLPQLNPFYAALFEIQEAVYGPP